MIYVMIEDAKRQLAALAALSMLAACAHQANDSLCPPPTSYSNADPNTKPRYPEAGMAAVIAAARCIATVAGGAGEGCSPGSCGPTMFCNNEIRRCEARQCSARCPTNTQCHARINRCVDSGY